MEKEYRIHRAVYKVERSFTGTKQARDLIRQRVIRASRNAAAVHASGSSVYQLEKKNKIS